MKTFYETPTNIFHKFAQPRTFLHSHDSDKNGKWKKATT